jgi:hypothetical protein
MRKPHNFWQSPQECREILDAVVVADWVMTWVIWFGILDINKDRRVARARAKEAWRRDLSF